MRIFREEANKLSEPVPARRRSSISDEELVKLAEKLGMKSSGKSREELIEEIVKKAREKGLLED